MAESSDDRQITTEGEAEMTVSKLKEQTDRQTDRQITVSVVCSLFCISVDIFNKCSLTDGQTDRQDILTDRQTINKTGCMC